MAATLLAIFADVAEDAHPSWHLVSRVLQDYDSESASVYISKPASASTLYVVFCIFHTPEAEMRDKASMISRALTPVMGTTPELRLYESLTSGQITEVRKQRHILVMNSMTPHPTAERAFDDWYTKEHIPLLRRVPSWLSSQRFILVSSSGGGLVPRYLALHKWDDVAAFETDEYKAATNTPWRTEVMREVIEKERLVLMYEGELENLIASRESTLL